MPFSVLFVPLMLFTSHHRFRWVLSGLFLLLTSSVIWGLSGCGYMIGDSFPVEVQTIAIPTFTNETYRRGIEFQLTEAVQQEVKNRTHFLIARESEADTRLIGKIVDIRKDVLGETRFDDPRELQYSIAVHLIWEDVRTGEILCEEQIEVPPDVVPFLGQAEFAPEVGQSLATAEYAAMQRLARQIVDKMEVNW